MSSPRAFLRQMAQFNLDPNKAYTKQHVGSDGHIRNRVERPAVVVQPAKVEAPMTNEEESKAKPTEAEKPASAESSAPKSGKSVKPATAKPVVEAKKVEAPTASQATGVKASDESTVEPKESTEPATASDAGATASTVKSS